MTAESLTALAVDVEHAHPRALITRGGKRSSPEQWGPGRFDALGRGGNAVFMPLNPDNLRPANASVSIPPLWGVWEYDWVQWAGSIQHPLARNIAQVIGVNAGLFAWAQPEPRFLPIGMTFFAPRSISARSRNWRRWPAGCSRRAGRPFPPIDRELAARGKDLYHGNKTNGIQNLCAHCHVATQIPNPHPQRS